MPIPDCRSGDHASRPNLAHVDVDALERAAAIFRALGEPGRLRILTLLAQRAMCVTELADVLVENVSTISQRLKLLRSERLARSRREGKHIYYALSDQHIADLVANAFDHANEPKRTIRSQMPARSEGPARQTPAAKSGKLSAKLSGKLSR